MRLTNKIIDHLIHFGGDHLNADNRKDMRKVVMRWNREERESKNESKREKKEIDKMLQENWEQLEANYRPKH